jgi:hypothetical protein
MEGGIMNIHLLKFKTHHGNWTVSDGTGLQGSITCQYDRLVKVFGEPYQHPDGSVDCEWDIVFVDGMIGTIYNWKNGINYKGLLGTPVEQIKNWNVGGHYAPVVPRIRELITTSITNELETLASKGVELYTKIGWV